MRLFCLDLEGTLMPEIWIEIAKRMRIEELKLTTRDVPDYDFLMRKRIKILKENKIKLKDIQKIIKKIKLFRGALNFLNWLREKFPAIILTDSFYEFLIPLLEKLSYPTIFCNSLKVSKDGFIENYHIRQENGKKNAVKALKSLGFEVIAIGDSYNDLEMLKEADFGILFNPPEKIAKEFSRFFVAKNYNDLKSKIESFLNKKQ